MHWNNGYFHESIIVNDGIHITHNKYNGICFDKEGSAVVYGDHNINTNIKGKYIKLDAAKGIVLDEKNYGARLPETGVNGQLFFRLISSSGD